MIERQLGAHSCLGSRTGSLRSPAAKSRFAASQNLLRKQENKRSFCGQKNPTAGSIRPPGPNNPPARLQAVVPLDRLERLSRARQENPKSTAVSPCPVPFTLILRPVGHASIGSRLRKAAPLLAARDPAIVLHVTPDTAQAAP
jgi:hypothetical protein